MSSVIGLAHAQNDPWLQNDHLGYWLLCVHMSAGLVMILIVWISWNIHILFIYMLFEAKESQKKTGVTVLFPLCLLLVCHHKVLKYFQLKWWPYWFHTFVSLWKLWYNRHLANVRCNQKASVITWYMLQLVSFRFRITSSCQHVIEIKQYNCIIVTGNICQSSST